MLLFRDQDAGQILNIKLEISYFERVEEFKYWEKKHYGIQIIFRKDLRAS
jgi:hypothetical protein